MEVYLISKFHKPDVRETRRLQILLARQCANPPPGIRFPVRRSLHYKPPRFWSLAALDLSDVFVTNAPHPRSHVWRHPGLTEPLALTLHEEAWCNIWRTSLLHNASPSPRPTQSFSNLLVTLTRFYF